MKKSILLTIAIVILIITVVFTLQNTIQIHINILFWNLETSLALLIFTTFSIGILVAIVFLTPSIINLKRMLNESKSKTNQLIEKEKNSITADKNIPESE
jgi:uncharacterized integral membrane protein